MEDEINQEHLDNMKILFMVNFNLTLILILVHFILIFISTEVITVFNFAPAVEDCHKEFSSFVDILIVNEVEVSLL